MATISQFVKVAMILGPWVMTGYHWITQTCQMYHFVWSFFYFLKAREFQSPKIALINWLCYSYFGFWQLPIGEKLWNFRQEVNYSNSLWMYKLTNFIVWTNFHCEITIFQLRNGRKYNLYFIKMASQNYISVG